MKKFLTLAALCVGGFSLTVNAATLADAEKLGTSLTPMGGQVEANADGSIPKYTGSTLGVPAGLKYSGSGDVYPDPYENEKPLYTITADNYAQYQDKLTTGTVALFKKHATFKINVFPTHRDFRYSDEITARTKWNVGHAKMVNGVDGLQGFNGAAPFPIPTSGAEVIWNARVNQPFRVADSLFDGIAVDNAGNHQKERQEMLVESPAGYGSPAVGKSMEDLGVINAGLVYIKTLEPSRKKGEMVIVHEPLDQVTNARKAWAYIPGAQRVKRAPTVGYDTPVGPGGLMTADDNMGFNGAMDRYDWKLIGKKEIIVPYHTYKFDTPSVKYKELLPIKHINPDYVRYELRRVWVVEATLKEGARHVYAKRVFYVEEDNWLIAATDIYDGRGELWRVGFGFSLYDYYLEGYLQRSQVNYDLPSSSYIVARLLNETRPSNYAAEIKGEKFFTPNNLRKMGRR